MSITVVVVVFFASCFEEDIGGSSVGERSGSRAL